MLDTLILSVKESDYQIIKPDLFAPSASKLSQYGFVGSSFKNNYKEAGKYFPRLTITPRSRGAGLSTTKDLKIEFSACKMVHGNNVVELSVMDYDFMIQNLYQRLNDMGIKILCGPNQIEVCNFDTAKNIILPKGVFCFEIIDQLSKCQVDKRFDLDNKEYRQGSGTTLQYYSKVHSVVFYDKIADLKKPNKRATDKDYNQLQKDLFDENYNVQMLRFEVRIRNKTKMKQVLKDVGYMVDTLYLSDIFNERLWRLILDNYWQKMIYGNNRFLFSMLKDDEIIANRIKEVLPNITPNKALSLIGLNHLAKTKGVDITRKIFEKKLGGKNWSRLNSEIQVLNQIAKNKDCYCWFQVLDQHLSIDKKLL